ncbi:hypothetical protein TEA_003432 [Camellia sinensis var. sinensis]|uniref:AAA+ ATPase domain-containing protein n=1 Tax=Camellia sinensis var. sinensis TaxID=542762 RepID=A0A4S4D6A8_CAMSN|nr:hypothetical protein TEA_003432 [Camellia sinensis var. sinensis]
MWRRIGDHPELHQLIEVVLDLGRKPLARFPSGDFVLSNNAITVDDLEHATSAVGDFAFDNRAGISRTLHRISAIRNRKGAIIGLTCRVGRAISGSANLLRDLVKDGASLLLIGPPGVGKTTIIRDIARMLANDYKKRVMIVDTSNEIGGDGDIPHAGIGSARRMQVPSSDMQHKVLIEAVENHMPQVIVIDEIGTKLEAMAASTIAQRGIQLVATAHGVTIKNLIMNPSLEMLVGGIQSVTLGDEEASRRRVQKTVLERKGPSTFSCGVEIISKNELRVHSNLEATVDAILLGRYPNYEIRKINPGSEDETLEAKSFIHESLEKNGGVVEDILQINDESPSHNESLVKYLKSWEKVLLMTKHLSACLFMGTCTTCLAVQAQEESRIQAAARSHGIPIYVTRTVDNGLVPVLSQSGPCSPEARIAIEKVVIPKGEPVELLPRPSNIILLQKDLIHKYKLQTERVGAEPDARLRILPYQTTRDDEDEDASESIDAVGSLMTCSVSMAKQLVPPTLLIDCLSSRLGTITGAIPLTSEELSVKVLQPRSGYVKGLNMRPSSSMKTTVAPIENSDYTQRLEM